MSASLLQLDGIAKRFGQVVVAQDLGLRVGPGEAVGIVGPNGAGKSSLFAMISGDLAPDAGTVTFRDRDVTGLKSHQRCRAGMGRTYQVPRPFEHMTVFENVLVCAHQGGGGTGHAAYDSALDVLQTTGLLHLSNDRAGTLPLLQRKRLEVARALATSPSLLLLDEVAGGLTEPEVAEVVDMVRAVNATGIAVVWIEHVVQALTATVERLVCLAGGRFVAEGTPQEVLADPTVRELYLGGGAVDEHELGEERA